MDDGETAGERKKKKKLGEATSRQSWKKFTNTNKLGAEWLCVGMWEKAGEDHREEERGLNCITAWQTALLRLERVELDAHGWLFKSTSHETPSALLLG